MTAHIFSEEDSMTIIKRSVFVPFALLALAPVPALAADYQVDSGDPSKLLEVVAAFGSPDGSPGFVGAIVRYTVHPDENLVNQLEYIWTGAAGGSATLGIWSDPNGDGLPWDAVPLWTTTLTGPGSSSLTSVLTHPVPLVDVGAPGSNFFVGLLHDEPFEPLINFVWPYPGELSIGNGISWDMLQRGGPIDPSDLGSAFSAIADDDLFVLRANGIPAPSGSLVLVACAGVLTSRRRRSI